MYYALMSDANFSISFCILLTRSGRVFGINKTSKINFSIRPSSQAQNGGFLEMDYFRQK